MTKVEWIAVDWGTSNLRLWAMDGSGAVVAAHSSAQGMGTLTPDAFEPALLELLAPYLSGAPLPVICCGMVGAKQGWVEAPYAQAPCPPPSTLNAISVHTTDPRISVRILPGVMQKSPGDVMRGEETQIAGFLAQEPGFDGTLCLPGTHSKWVQISAGEIVSFKTFMSGELFALLSENSVLRHNVGGAGFSDEAFGAAVDDAMGAPQQFASRLFGLRADSLVNGLEPSTARAKLSGLLIGLELAGSKPYWLGQQIKLIGAPDLCNLYKAALDRQAAMPQIVPGEELVLDGLKAAYRALSGELK